MTGRSKVDAQPAYVLHSYPFRETSLLCEVFSRDFGRVALLARGARRPRSAIRGLLMGFQPVEVGWSGKGEVLTLTKVEWQGGQPLLSGDALFCGYYLNELLLHLLPREDAHPRIFRLYAEMLLRLAHAPAGQVDEADLRGFEKHLLGELGYGLTLDRDAHGQPIETGQFYVYEIEQGPVRLADKNSQALAIRGKTLLDMAQDDFSDPRSRSEAKTVMRSLIGHYLSGNALHSRQIYRLLQGLPTG